MAAALACMIVPHMAGAQSYQLESLGDRGKLLGWEAVGRIDLPGGFCTGALIARDLVLTAAHCMYDSRGRPIAPDKITFRAGYHNGKQIAVSGVTRWVVPEAYEANDTGRSTAEMIRNDVALMRLAQPMVSAEADPFRIHQVPAKGTAVSVVSYGQGRSEVLSRQAECAMTAEYFGGLLGFDCNTTYGSSGAPVFVKEDGRLRILSVISGGSAPGQKGNESIGMALPSKVAELKRQMRNDTARPVVSAGARRITVGQRSNTGARFVKP